MSKGLTVCTLPFIIYQGIIFLTDQRRNQSQKAIYVLEINIINTKF